MSNVNNYAYKRYLYSEQIKNSLITIRYFLLSICLVSTYIYVVFSLFFGYSEILNIWFNLTEIIIFISLCITLFKFRFGTYSDKHADLWVKSVCITIGLMLALGTFVLYFQLPMYVKNFNYYQGLNLSFILIGVSLVFALAFLNQKLIYFLILFFPVILPFLYAQITLTLDNHLLFFISTDFILISIFICASISVRIQNKLTNLLFRNKLLVEDAEEQILVQNKLNTQLKIEMEKSKAIELKLQEYSQILEYKIKERTLDLEIMHQNLKNKQTNLILAHDIAGLTPWDWNIKERKITLNKKSNKRSLDSDSITLDFNKETPVHPSDVKHFTYELKRHLRGLSDQFEATYRIQCNDNKWHWVHDIGRVISRNPKNNFAIKMVGIRRDINKERLDQERLKLSASVLQQAAEGIFILDEDLKYIDVNPFYEKLTGFEREILLGKQVFEICINKQDNQQLMHNSIITKVLTTGKYDDEITEQFLSGKELTLRFHINAIKDDLNRTINYIGIVSDLTEKRLQEQRLSYLENYDTLTDLPNRIYYNYQLHQYVVTHQNSVKQLAIIRLNIDRFRPLNEYLKQSGGDELLRQLAQRLRLSNDEALFLAHLNSDNFAIVYELSHLRPSIHEQCEKIMRSLSTPFNINGEDHHITVSMGVSFYPEHGRQVDYLNSYAEQALKEAKSLGGNMVRIYNLRADVLLNQDIYIERDLRHAIKNHELVVHYQPKVYFDNSQIQGFEALIRWNHPTKGLIPPNMFLPIAEQTSLISEIGTFVILETAKQIQKWKLMGYENIIVSLNVVAQQLHRGNLLETIDHALQKYNISGENLELEITESSLVDQTDLVKKILEQIKMRRIHIALDDFGTGYSSLSYLTHFPIDTLKIDRSFVLKIGHPKQEPLVSAIIAMGKAMGMTLVAEGVETEEQKQYLSNLQCDIAQGFLFSKPLTENDATTYLVQHYQK